MLRSVLVLVSTALVWTAAPRISAEPQVPADSRMRFAAMDRNRDGQITRDEWQGSARSFAVHDWNGDGKLSGAEVRTGAQRGTDWTTVDHNPTTAERYLSYTQAGFRNLDHNRDNRLTANEWHYDLETFRRMDANRDNALTQAEFLGADNDDLRGDQFDDIDANNDGVVSRREWYGSTAAFNTLDRNNDGVLSRFEVVGSRSYSDSIFDQFLSLDYDESGAITRDEWHWSLASFNTRDANRDGRISRDEFARMGGTPATPASAGGAAQPRTVRVDPKQRWTDSGIDVRYGDILTFSASGTINMMTNADDRATPAGSVGGRRAADAPLLNEPAGALIARIGDVSPIFIGTRQQVTAPASGRLYLGVNDDHLADNTGFFNVQVARVR